MKTKLKDNERLIKEGSANYFNSQFDLDFYINEPFTSISIKTIHIYEWN